jgi:hypothetical protein
MLCNFKFEKSLCRIEIRILSWIRTCDNFGSDRTGSTTLVVHVISWVTYGILEI